MKPIPSIKFHANVDADIDHIKEEEILCSTRVSNVSGRFIIEMLEFSYQLSWIIKIFE